MTISVTRPTGLPGQARSRWRERMQHCAQCAVVDFVGTGPRVVSRYRELFEVSRSRRLPSCLAGAVNLMRVCVEAITV